MKAAVIEKPNVLTVRDVPQPAAGEYQALCRMLYGAVCTGTDQHLIANRFPWPVAYPTILGHESIAEVVAVGGKVRNFKVGDRVTRVGSPPVGGFNAHWGGFAEYGLAGDYRAMREDGLPAAQWNGARVNQVLPPGIEPAGATMIITWRETLSYIRRLGVVAGSSVLVIGSGGNGLSFASHAANLGARKVAVIGAAARRDAAMSAGAACYVDYKAPDVAAAVADACGNDFDFIIDAVGKSGPLDLVLGALRPGGVVGVYGIDDYHGYRINPRKSRGNFTFLDNGYDEEESHAAVIQFVQQGKLNPGIWLTNLSDPIPLARIADAFKLVRDRKAIKPVVKLS